MIKVFRFVLLTSILINIVILSSCIYTSKSSGKLLERAKGTTYDMIIVPGIPLENGKWSRTMKGRIYWSKYLYDIGVAKNIMYSGSAVYSPYCEAEVMAMYAEAIGIPRENIFTETKAEHSTENIYYGYQKAKKLGFNSIALATDPFQSKMLRQFVKTKISQDVGIIPMISDTLKMIEPQMIDPVIDFEKAMVKDYVPLKERESFWKRFRGTRGLNIDKSAY